jgi:hypothetical protein
VYPAATTYAPQQDTASSTPAELPEIEIPANELAYLSDEDWDYVPPEMNRTNQPSLCSSDSQSLDQQN